MYTSVLYIYIYIYIYSEADIHELEVIRNNRCTYHTIHVTFMYLARDIQYIVVKSSETGKETTVFLVTSDVTVGSILHVILLGNLLEIAYPGTMNNVAIVRSLPNASSDVGQNIQSACFISKKLPCIYVLLHSEHYCFVKYV